MHARSATVVLSLWVSSLGACHSGDPGARGTPSATAAAPSPAAPTTAKGAATATATSATAAPTGPAKWTAFTGPKATVALSGPKAWATLPVALPDFGTVKITRLDWVEARGDEQLFRFMSQEVLVPNAATAPSKAPSGLAPGAPVVVAVNVTSVPGRVVSVGPKVKVRHRFATNIQEEEFAPEDLLPITGKLAFGVPVAYREGGAWHPGQLVTTTGDPLWVIGFGAIPKAIPAADVVAVDPKRRTKGETVAAAYAGKYYKGPVLEVLDDGLHYKVDVGFPMGEVDASFGDVTAPLP